MPQLESTLQEGTHPTIRLLFAGVDHSSRQPLHDVRVRTTLHFPHHSTNNLPGGVPGETWDRRTELHRFGYWHHRSVPGLGSCHGQVVRETEAEVRNGETRVPFM